MNKYDLQQYQIALQFLKGIGPIKARKLLNSTELLSDIFETDYNSLARNTGLPKASLVQMQREEALQMAKEHLKNIHYLGLQTHFITDSSYPRRLKNCEDAPLLLFSDGEMNLNSSRMLAVVGTRNATNYGRKICDELIEHIAGEDIVVVSGMAYGIDIYMHQLCVRHDIPTIGVLGHGLDRVYPTAHKNTGNKMKLNGGLLTEYVPYTNPDRENFPKRNRIVSGMCDAIMVVESKARGGSLITAQLANDYSREVFAVPGNLGQEYSEGCNQLISSQLAHLYLGPKSLLDLMNWSKEKKSEVQYSINWEQLSEPQVKVCRILKEDGPTHLDQIRGTTHFDPGELGLVLFELEMQGMIRPLPGMLYTLTA